MFLYPRGYYSGCGFLKVPGDAFIRRRFFIYYPCGFYLGYGFTKIPGDVFIPPMCTIQQHRVPYTCLNGRKLGFRKFSREPSTKVPFGWFLGAGDAIKEVRFSPKVIISTMCHSYTWFMGIHIFHGHFSQN